MYVSKVCLNVVLSLFPEYVRIHNEVHVRISELPIQDSLRDLRYGLCKPDISFYVVAVMQLLTSSVFRYLQAIPVEHANQGDGCSNAPHRRLSSAQICKIRLWQVRISHRAFLSGRHNRN